jgi:hypothetical protein
MKLWVDDERPAPDDTWLRAYTSDEAILLLLEHSVNPIEEVSLDHDLGGEDTGMEVLDFIIDIRIWPRTLTIHTANPPARKQMLLAANAEAPDWVDIYVKTW